MRRFLRLMSLTIQARMVYRGTFLLGLLTPLVLLCGQVLLYQSLYAMRGGAPLGPYDQANMYSYILIAFFINNLLTWSSENALAREIRSGNVVVRKVRPVAFLGQTLADMVGNLALQAVVNTGVLILAFWLFQGHLRLPAPESLPLFILSLGLAVLLRMTLVATYSLLCFYTTGHLGLTWTRTALTEFFSGALIPVALFPAWLKAFSYASPFPLMLQVPVSLFLGEPLPMPVGRSFALQALWIAIFLGLHSFLYRHIRRNATLAGG